MTTGVLMRRLGLLLVPAASILLAACTAASTSPPPSMPADATEAPSVAASVVATPTPVEVIPSPEPSSSLDVEPTPSPDFTRIEERSFKGRGDKIVRFDVTDNPFVAAFTHSGSGNFIVHSLDPELDEVDLLINEIGRDKGSVLGEWGDYGGLSIEANGPWTLEITDLYDVPGLSSPTTMGRGDSVLFFDGDNTVARFTHEGEANFIVKLWDSGDGELLINDIGKYDGEQIISSGYLSVMADGPWTITLD